MKFLALMGGLLAALALVACGNDGSADSTDSGTGSTPAQKPAAAGRVTEVTGPHSKLKVRIPPGPPPKHLVVRTIKEGSGPALENLKDEIFVNYTGIEYTSGNEFYNSWDQGGPSKFLLEETHKGWELGLKGMKVGGIRKLITPPKLEYGTDTLIYIIELAKLRQAG